MTPRILATMPRARSQFAKAAWDAVPVPGRSNRPAAPDLDALQVRVGGVRIDPDRLARYRDVCGFPPAARASAVPATYPHVLAFPLHLELLTDARFPFPAIGTVHIANQVTTTGRLEPGQLVSIDVRTEDLAPHPRGRQVTLATEIAGSGSDEVLWSSRSILLRHEPASGAGSGASAPDLDVPERAPSGPVRWRLPAGLGRRYAAVSGDFNPIHLADLTALPLGFRHHIAHGMWSKARCLAELGHRLPAAYDVSVAFRKPVRLPSTVSFGARHLDGGVVDFGLMPADPAGTPHLVGRVRALDERGRPAS